MNLLTRGYEFPNRFSVYEPHSHPSGLALAHEFVAACDTQLKEIPIDMMELQPIWSLLIAMDQPYPRFVVNTASDRLAIKC